MARDHSSSHPAPFLRNISTLADRVTRGEFPFTVPAFSAGIDLRIEKPITFLVGENGSGKSTLLEGVATKCGYNVLGGGRNHSYGRDSAQSQLAAALRLSWAIKPTQGFFLRAESFFDFATYIDELASGDRGLLDAYGGKSLHEQSHGESFLSLFVNRFNRGFFILDEPEAALSPQRQLAFMRVLHDLELTGQSQFLIATHSPMLFSYPSADVIQIDNSGLHKIDYRESEHFRLVKRYLDSPERYLRHLFRDEE
jgi:predicted ATPase